MQLVGTQCKKRKAFADIASAAVLYLIPLATLPFVAATILCLVALTGLWPSVAIIFVSSTVSNTVGMFPYYNHFVFAVAVLMAGLRTGVNRRIANYWSIIFVVYALVITYGYIRGVAWDRTIESLYAGLVFIAFSITAFAGGLVVARYAADRPDRVRSAIDTLLFALVITVVAQFVFGPLSFLPIHAIDQYSDKAEIVGTGSRLWSRYIGPTNGPNTLSLIAIFLLLGRVVTVRHCPAVFWSAVLFLVASGKSEAAAIILLILIIFYITAKNGGIKSLAKLKFLSVVLAFLAIIILSVNWNQVVAALQASQPVRYDVYLHMIQKFDLGNFLLGIGPKNWLDYFDRVPNIDLSDPHSLIFSVPGSFGLPGLVFYLFLGGVLINGYIRSKDWSLKFVFFGLLVLTFLRDLVSIPLPLGSTHLTFWYWFIVLTASHQTSDRGRLWQD